VGTAEVECGVDRQCHALWQQRGLSAAHRRPSRTRLSARARPLADRAGGRNRWTAPRFGRGDPGEL